MGMLDQSAAQQGAPKQDIGVMNPMLEKIEASIEAKVPPKLKEAYHRIVSSGVKIAVAPSPKGSLIQNIESSQNPVNDVAVGVVGLLMIMYQQSKNTMPVDAAIYAGMTLVLYGLDVYERGHKGTVSAKEIDDATQLYVATVMPKFGVSEQMLKSKTDQAKTVMDNPQMMSAMKAKQAAKGGV